MPDSNPKEGTKHSGGTFKKNGQWHCGSCGTGIGKNLRDQIGWGAIKKHADSHTKKD